jgi:hypothetical protein
LVQGDLMGAKLDLVYFSVILGFFILYLHDFMLIQSIGSFEITSIKINEPNFIIWLIEVILIIFVIVMTLIKMGGVVRKRS